MKNSKQDPSNPQVLSAVLPEQYPPADRPEIAIVGRSNAGKSTLVNQILGEKRAYVSQQPGKTRLLNFYTYSSYRWVDLPGYGYSKRDLAEMAEWTKMIETYLSIRGNLSGVVLIMDCRREWEDGEEMLRKFLSRIGIPIVVALNKVDKLRPHEAAKTVQQFKKKYPDMTFFPVSAESGTGVKELEDFVFKSWVKGK